MLSPQAAATAMQIAKGVIKLVQRVDLVLAEKEATQAALALPLPKLDLEPTVPQMRKALERVLVDTEKDKPDPLGKKRKPIGDALTDGDRSQMLLFTKEFAPDLMLKRRLDLNKAWVEALQEARPDWAADPDMVVSAFYISAGPDTRKKDYRWRLTLTVVDALADFGGASMALFTRDEKVQAIVGSVLRRFGEADVQKAESGHAVLRAALGATLNGALDARAALGVRNEWLDAGLDAIAQARASLPKGRQDGFLLGLVRGEGYPALVGALLEAAAGRIDNSEAVNFRDVTADFLKTVAGIVKKQEGLGGFFENNWADLVRGALGAVEKNAEALLGERKLLGKILKRVAGDLAATPENRLLSRDMLAGIVNGIAATAAANPDEVEKLVGGKTWVASLLGSVAGTVADAGIRKVVSKEGVEQLFKDAFGTFAAHPDLLVGDSELAGALVGGVLKQLSVTAAYDAGALATAAVGGALKGIAANPDVVDFEYPELVAAFAGKVGTLVTEGTLSGIQGADILRAVTASLAENPQFFFDVELEAADALVAVIERASADRPLGLVAGATMTALVGEVMHAFARSGVAALENHAGADLVQQLGDLIDAALTRAEDELGRRIGLPALPGVIGQLVDAWARGKIATLDADNENFKRLFAELAERSNG